MSRFNFYEQQTAFSGGRADAGSFGAAPAQALEGAGNALYEIGQRIQEREDLSERQRLRESFEEAVVPMLDDFGKRRDINTKESIPQFRQALIQKRQELVSKHAGNPESRAKLENQLDNLVSQYTKSAIGTKIKADQELMVRTLNQQFDKSALDTDAAPDIWSFAKDENLMLVEEMRPGMSQDQYVAAKRLAYAKPLQAAVKSHLAQRNWEGAEAIMRDENFSKFLTAEEAIPLRIDVAVGRGKAAKEEREVESNRKALSYLLGTEATREQALTVPGLASMPVVQKLNVMKMMNGGRELPQETVNRVLGIERQNNESLTNEVLDEAANYRNMTPEQQFIHRQKAAKVFGLTRRVDDKGYTSTFSNIPGELLNLYGMDERGNLVGTGGAGGITDSVAGSEKSEVRTMLEQEGYPIDERGEFIPGGQRGQRGPGGQRTRADVEPARIPPTRSSTDLTVDEMLYDVAGVFSAIGEYAARTPGIGTVAKDSQRVVDYKARVVSAGNNIVSLLQKNDKYPEGERQMIAAEVAKVIRLWDNPESAARNLRSIELGLQDRQKAAEEIRDDVNLNKDTRDSARIMATQIKNYRKQLGVLQPKDEKEIKQLVDEGELYPGRNFWTPEGKRKKFTQEAYDEIIGGKKK